MIDIRLNPSSQLSAYARKDDLAFFLNELLSCEYIHQPLLAPSKEILSEYREYHNWDKYVAQFEALMDERNMPEQLDRALFEDCCLLCSEAEPDKCHRRLIAERLAKAWPGTEIAHL